MQKQYIMRLHIFPAQWSFHSFWCLLRFFRHTGFLPQKNIFFKTLNSVRLPVGGLFISKLFPIDKYQPTAEDSSLAFVCWFKPMRKECCTNNISWCDIIRTHDLSAWNIRSYSSWIREGMFIYAVDFLNIPSCVPVNFPSEF